MSNSDKVMSSKWSTFFLFLHVLFVFVLRFVLTDAFCQVIQGNALGTTLNLVNLTSFGTSLSSGVDIDGNTYNGM